MKDPRVDAYIEKSADFAQPILTHFRYLVHSAYPNIQETIKWGMPSFEHKGIVCGMAAFKAHCAFSFPKANLINDPQKILEAVGKTAMGSFGQVKTLIDLPDDGYIKDLILQAVKLNEQETKIPVKKSIAKPVSIPDGLKSALERNDKAAAVFNKLSASHQREYCAYIAEAKKEETRLRRVGKTVEMLLEGKALHADYGNKR